MFLVILYLRFLSKCYALGLVPLSKEVNAIRKRFAEGVAVMAGKMLIKPLDSRISDDLIRIKAANIDHPETRGPKACEAGNKASAYNRSWRLHLPGFAAWKKYFRKTYFRLCASTFWDVQQREFYPNKSFEIVFLAPRLTMSSKATLESSGCKFTPAMASVNIKTFRPSLSASNAECLTQ